MYAPPPGPPPATVYAPPPGPPPHTAYAPSPATAYPFCQNASELSAYVRSSLATLASQGWLSVPLPPDLEALYTRLFAQSASYFDLPSDAREKTAFAAPTGKAASDEGFSDIPGEKQLITLRRVSGTPASLRETAMAAWDATGALFLDTVREIADSLELEDTHIFDEMSCEANGFAEKVRASSLLRLFRYNRPDGTLGTKKIVAEGHKDLGLLTLVVGQSPGLDVRDVRTGAWVSVEETPPPGGARLTGTLLAGQTLTYLTRGLYAAGSHRVSVLPPAAPGDDYRFSLVFALRPTPDALIDTARFAASPLVGAFPPERLSFEANNYPHCSMHGQPARELFRCIAQQHWNVNIAPEVREEQRRLLASGSTLVVDEKGRGPDGAGEARLG
ncbi:hypothetical protein GGX14DRAFT_372318 [Mycena pura]|uniref:Fe2OG dioxygenase domain-containing protein n=1 Tax=Mycena pura TaxID=153505 RepID=A0AAD6V5F7_9AGAR|nr:hypothetical protein GGX14DRAFT_372318 [Mycena pura]